MGAVVIYAVPTSSISMLFHKNTAPRPQADLSDILFALLSRIQKTESVGRYL